MTKKEKILQNVAKSSTNGSKASSTTTSKATNGNALVEQFNVIREDVLKLRDDLARGYDMAREMLDKKTLMKEFLKAK